MKGILWGLKPTVVSLIATAGIGIFTQALFTGESPSSGSDRNPAAVRCQEGFYCL